jgi:N-acetylmuramic acid 6-phosphate etherase
MKGGTAQKLARTRISTVSMVKPGRTDGNLLVDVVASSDKLQAGGDVEVAIASILAETDAAPARNRLECGAGVVRRALERA